MALTLLAPETVVPPANSVLLDNWVVWPLAWPIVQPDSPDYVEGGLHGTFAKDLNLNGHLQMPSDCKVLLFRCMRFALIFMYLR